MRQEFEIQHGQLVETSGGSIRLYVEPTHSERLEILEACGIDEHTLDSALDPEEVARIEVEPDHMSIIWKRPNSASFRTAGLFEVSSLGVVLRAGRLTFLAAEASPPLTRRRTRSISSIHDFLLRELAETVHHFLEHLRAIKLMARSIQLKLNASVGNEHLVPMFALCESLVYYTYAIEANGVALDLLRAKAESLRFTEDERRFLDDVIIENKQCALQATIYSRVLSGLMDARGSIVNNNMNVLLKNLTLINVIFLPLGVVAGVFGMSEFTLMTESSPAQHNWWWTYPVFILGLCALGYGMWRVLMRWMNRTMQRGGAEVIRDRQRPETVLNQPPCSNS